MPLEKHLRRRLGSPQEPEDDEIRGGVGLGGPGPVWNRKRRMQARPPLCPVARTRPFGGLVSMLLRHRRLTWELAKREVGERYAGQMLGVVWAVGHPLLLMALYVFVFAYVFPTRLSTSYEMPRSFAAYILSGLIPWLCFADAMNRGVTAVTNNASLVKQVVFPVEVLPMKVLAGPLLTQAVATLSLLVYLLLTDAALPATAALWPLLFVLQATAMIGVC